ncbi:FAS-associated factor 1-like isoform X1 [Paramacrobiotus metropolitanus]|uniref:FAS-associated factor 1-like isoform X1 n=1 Tax=Paramacrobiotus metropolitanus TaxID=2943436 RepID=UPI002445A069|nr:FAS-associated factor 1-like isoform X1 [Paramacrobiotus metropolitanus]XP_055335550.1 FAS-associated factor 1-like isoform X1 [Paramacrobiotus metropolitanus]
MEDYEFRNGSHKMAGDEDIVFKIHYGEHTIRLELPESEKVGDLKRLLRRKTGLKDSEMELLGWDDPDIISDEMTFAELGLAKDYHLVLRPVGDHCDDRMGKTYHVQVIDQQNDETYNLFFNGMQTVREAKAHLAELSNISFEKQSWSGWPWPLHDEQYLSEVGLRTPNHELRLSKLRDREPAVYERSQSSELNYEVETDDMDESDTVDVSPRIAQRGSLVPDASLSITDAVRLFVQNFESRYGANHPPFYEGTLREAMSYAFDRPVMEKKLFALYVHNDRSISVNIFVTQVLQDPVLIQYLTEHAVLWPWDVTIPESRIVLRNEIEEIIGAQVSIPLTTTNVDKFPMLFICTKMRGSVELLKVVDGTKSAQEVFEGLEIAERVHGEAQESEMLDQQARANRAMMVEEQNQAYLVSLEADRAKDVARKAVENEKKEAENREKEELRLRQQKQDEAGASLPPEPQQDNGDVITVIRLRTPDGKSVTRKFLASSPIKHLFAFAHANGFSGDDYNLVSSYPKKMLSGLDPNKTFKDLGLTQQVAVFVEER